MAVQWTKGTDPSTEVAVTWRKDEGTVNFGVKHTSNVDEVWNYLVEKYKGTNVISDRDKDNYISFAVVPAQFSDMVTSEEGLYLDLDRAGINKLIRDLRTARDSAFGKDA